MLKPIIKANFDEIRHLLIDYLQNCQNQEDYKPNILIDYENEVQQGTIQIYVISLPDNFPVAMLSIRRIDSATKAGRISFYYIHHAYQGIKQKGQILYEDILFVSVLQRLKQTYNQINIHIDDLSENISVIIKQEGFKDIKRAGMEINLSNIKILTLKQLNKSYSFIEWSDSYLDQVKNILFDINTGTTDQQVFPELQALVSTKNYIKELIQSDRQSKTIVLKQNNQIIGFCFLTTISEKMGFIQEVGIAKKMQGKGLGKALISYSLKNMITKDRKIEKVFLAVTLDNIPAFKLYQKLGFEVVGTGAHYIWIK